MAAPQPNLTGFASLDGTAENSGIAVQFDGVYRRKDENPLFTNPKFYFELRPKEAATLCATHAAPDGESTPFTVFDEYWKVPMAKGKLSVSINPKNLKKGSIYHLEGEVIPYQFTDKKTGKEYDGYYLVYTSATLADDQAIPAVAKNLVTHKTVAVKPKKVTPKPKASSTKSKKKAKVAEPEEEYEDVEDMDE